jgi:ribosomal protein S12
MSQKIIYPNEKGIAVITPTGVLSVEETALKDVPSGVKYKIIDVSDLPADRDFRNAWEFDFSENFDGVGS